MTLATVCGLNLVALLFAAEPQVPKTLEPLQGTWVHTSFPMSIVVKDANAKVVGLGGSPERPFLGITSPMEFTLEVTPGNEFSEIDVIDVNEAQKPRIAGMGFTDILPKKGPIRLQGIYKITGNELTLRVGGVAGRPKSFESEDEGGTVRFKKLDTAEVKEFTGITGVWKFGMPRFSETIPFYAVITPGWVVYSPVEDKEMASHFPKAAGFFSIGLNSEKSPREFDCFELVDDNRFLRGNGIYELQRDKLMLQVDQAIGKRPLKFEPTSKVRVQSIQFVLERFDATNFTVPRVPPDSEAILGTWVLRERFTRLGKKDVLMSNSKEEKWKFTADEITIDSGADKPKTYKYKLGDNRRWLDLHLPADPDKVHQYAVYSLKGDTLSVSIYPLQRPAIGTVPQNTKQFTFRRDK